MFLEGGLEVENDVKGFDIAVVDPTPVYFIDFCFQLVVFSLVLLFKVFFEQVIIEAVDVVVQAEQTFH